MGHMSNVRNLNLFGFQTFTLCLKTRVLGVWIWTGFAILDHFYFYFFVGFIFFVIFYWSGPIEYVQNQDCLKAEHFKCKEIGLFFRHL